MILLFAHFVNPQDVGEQMDLLNGGEDGRRVGGIEVGGLVELVHEDLQRAEVWGLGRDHLKQELKFNEKLSFS